MGNETSAGRGRPPLPDDVARRHLIRLRVTEAERDEIARAAQDRGETMSELIRRVVLRLARR